MASKMPSINHPCITHPWQLAYSFLYGLWKYQWDADCELFLKILMVRATADGLGAML